MWRIDMIFWRGPLLDCGDLTSYSLGGPLCYVEIHIMFGGGKQQKAAAMTMKTNASSQFFNFKCSDLFFYLQFAPQAEVRKQTVWGIFHQPCLSETKRGRLFNLLKLEDLVLGLGVLGPQISGKLITVAMAQDFPINFQKFHRIPTMQHHWKPIHPPEN